jgi:multidrug transporter EmrE-like cation transporter
MTSLVIVFGLILAIVALETCAMTCLKKSKDGWQWFFAGVLFYVGVATLVARSLSIEGMAITNALWSGISLMATTSVGVLAFKEVLHLHDYIAIAMIGGGLVVLKITK